MNKRTFKRIKRTYPMSQVDPSGRFILAYCRNDPYIGLAAHFEPWTNRKSGGLLYPPWFPIPLDDPRLDRYMPCAAMFRDPENSAEASRFQYARSKLLASVTQASSSLQDSTP